jgi:hypothetical protein
MLQCRTLAQARGVGMHGETPAEPAAPCGSGIARRAGGCNPPELTAGPGPAAREIHTPRGGGVSGWRAPLGAEAESSSIAETISGAPVTATAGAGRRGSAHTRLMSAAPGPHGHPLRRGSPVSDASSAVGCGDSFRQQLRTAVESAATGGTSQRDCGPGIDEQQAGSAVANRQQQRPTRMLSAEQRHAPPRPDPCRQAFPGPPRPSGIGSPMVPAT